MTRHRCQPRSSWRRRPLHAECLEQRQMLAVDFAPDPLTLADQLSFTPLEDAALEGTSERGGMSDQAPDDSASPVAPEVLHNHVHPLDVDVSGDISPLDALLVINALNHGGPYELPVEMES